MKCLLLLMTIFISFSVSAQNLAGKWTGFGRSCNLSPKNAQ